MVLRVLLPSIDGRIEGYQEEKRGGEKRRRGRMRRRLKEERRGEASCGLASGSQVRKYTADRGW